MSTECCAHDAPVSVGGGEHAEHAERAERAEPHTPRPWWRNPGLRLPLASGLAFLAGLGLEWFGGSAQELAAQIAFALGLALGAVTFVPAALRTLLRRGRVGIGLLMAISAAGAVLLGYLGEAAALAFLYSLAEALEDAAMDRARGGLRALLSLVPETATVRRGEFRAVIPARELVPGDLLLVRPGERIATDGVIRAGRSALDTSAITGESLPVAGEPGLAVSAGTIAVGGALEVEATAAGSDNSLTTIVTLVERAQAEKGERARLADQIARPLVPGVIVLAGVVGILGSLLGDPATWITRALVVLVAASPCALAIAVPVTVVSAIGAASRFGIVVKSGAAFERLGAVRRLAIDKTGTLTQNRPEVTELVVAPGESRAGVLALAAALEQHSSHPLAAAITAAGGGAQLVAREVTEVTEFPGSGVRAVVDDEVIAVGSPRWLEPGTLADAVARLEYAGHSCVVVSRGARAIGVIGVRDELRAEAAETVAMLGERGITVAMLTGDNARAAQALAVAAGIREVHAELRPEQKSAWVARSTERATTAMIGDGVNDAPALAAASVGIAMGVTGSDAAIESADVAFTGHDLRLIPLALAHARRGRAIMTQNVVLSLGIIAVLLPLAMTGVLGLAAVVLVHELAEVLVIGNGLRAARVPRVARAARLSRVGRGL